MSCSDCGSGGQRWVYCVFLTVEGGRNEVSGVNERLLVYFVLEWKQDSGPGTEGVT